MDLVPGNQFRGLDNIEHGTNSLFDIYPFRAFSHFSSPKIDIYQTEGDVILKAEIPGVLKEDLNVYIDKDSIRLSGMTRKNEEYEENNVYKTERSYGSFSRTISLPADVIADQATAEYKDGILSVTVPKTEPRDIKGHRIDVQ